MRCLIAGLSIAYNLAKKGTAHASFPPAVAVSAHTAISQAVIGTCMQSDLQRPLKSLRREVCHYAGVALHWSWTDWQNIRHGALPNTNVKGASLKFLLVVSKVAVLMHAGM